MNVEQRSDLYRLLGAMVLSSPTDELLATLSKARAFLAFGECAEGRLRDSLVQMDSELAHGVECFGEIRRDYIALFIGPKKKLAPPWESVYRSPDRIVMQEQSAEVLRAYAEQRIGFDGMGQSPADHAGFELEFVSILLARSRRSKKAREALSVFLADHVLAWIPAWAADVRKHAKTVFMCALGDALTSLCDLEWKARETTAKTPRRSLPLLVN